jgi:uncharacterized membrane protein YeaQ/YmgE (transglycosylase-associated protein family)
MQESGLGKVQEGSLGRVNVRIGSTGDKDRVFCRRSNMGIISWIILGLIAGFIGSKIVNKQGQGFWLNIALGIVGALVGGFLFDFFGAAGVTGFNLYSMIVAIVGSIVVLVIYNAVTGRRNRA